MSSDVDNSRAERIAEELDSPRGRRALYWAMSNPMFAGKIRPLPWEGYPDSPHGTLEVWDEKEYRLAETAEDWVRMLEGMAMGPRYPKSIYKDWMFAVPPEGCLVVLDGNEDEEKDVGGVRESGLNEQFAKLSRVTPPGVQIPLPPPTKGDGE